MRPTEVAPAVVKPSTILRHGLSVLMLFFAWKYLQDWYLYRSLADLKVYVALFCGAFLLALLGFLTAYSRSIADVSSAKLTLSPVLR